MRRVLVAAVLAACALSALAAVSRAHARGGPVDLPRLDGTSQAEWVRAMHAQLQRAARPRT